MAERFKHYLPAFGAAAVFALLFPGPAAVWNDGQTIRLGRLAVGVPLSWLVMALLFTVMVYHRADGKPRRMKDWLLTFAGAALFGLLAVAPFAFMEVRNNPGIRSGELAFPFTLFHGMWLFPTMLFLAATPVVRGVRAGENVLAHPIGLMLRVSFLVLVAAVWLLILSDQMPCFLGGVPGCD